VQIAGPGQADQPEGAPRGFRAQQANELRLSVRFDHAASGALAQQGGQGRLLLILNKKIDHAIFFFQAYAAQFGKCHFGRN